MAKLTSRCMHIAALCCLLITVKLSAQSEKLNKIVNAVEEYTQKYPQEKVYLHTDRGYYAIGESIWFQTYLTAGPLHLPSPLSYPVYVQLINQDQKLIDQKVVLTPNGFGSGVIDLPDTLSTGEYTLVAFTNWMRNTGEEFFFRKRISVLGNDDKDIQRIIRLNDIDVQFFPEGGYLVKDIPSKVAFKAIDANGKGIEVTGNIVDETGQIIASIKTEHLGMGSFYITPKGRASYSAKINGIKDAISLPEVRTEGLGLRLMQSDNDTLKLTLTANIVSERQKYLSVLIHRGGLVTFSAEIDLSGQIAFVKIPTVDMPSGVSHITVFDQRNKALMERLIFIDNTVDHVILESNKKLFGKREKVTAKVKLDASMSDSLNGVFSMSVYDIGQTIDREPESNIITELLLNSDLKGNLENPVYYFNKENPQVSDHLDLVMLTHGWSRFDWEEVLEKKGDELEFDFERGLTLTGKTVRAFTDKSQASKVSMVNFSQALSSLLETETTKDGLFEFKDLTVFEGDKLILKGIREKGKKKKVKGDIQFKIDSSFYQASAFFEKSINFRDVAESQFNYFLEQNAIREKINEAYDFDSTARRLDDIIVESSRIESKEVELLKTVFGRGTNAIDFTAGPPIGVNNILQAMTGKIPGVVIGPLGSSVTIRSNGLSSVPPLFLYDDVAVPFEYIIGLVPDQVYKVVVFKGAVASARFGSAGFGGAMAFYSRTGAGIIEEGIEKEDGISPIKIKNSYQQPRAFYTPKYDVQQPEHVKPDYRILLHWQPMIFIGPEKEAAVEFWASDLETTVLVNVQGLLQDGTPVSKVIYFEIEK